VKGQMMDLMIKDMIAEDDTKFKGNYYQLDELARNAIKD